MVGGGLVGWSPGLVGMVADSARLVFVVVCAWWFVCLQLYAAYDMLICLFKVVCTDYVVCCGGFVVWCCGCF